ncbi:hypothetical protein J5N97_025173 [Dioscorea zingiberensis]|uniref:Cytochrome P450 n=1 Tax=Dioscorea zingiberensis TaxID=325984 RepID=A0A9D5C814_9LILI|nr:hypothetical protein J5N97_025173 [Dioscorea zingiberensis]
MEFLSELSSLATTITVLVITALLIKISKRILLKSDRKEFFPPMAGTIFHQLLNFRTVHDYHTKLSHKYKTFRLFTPVGNQTYTVDPENIEYILRTNFKNYVKGEHTHRNCEELFGDGIFAIDGEKWRHQRKLASYEFSTRVLRDFSGVVFRSNAAKVASIVHQGASSNQTLEIQDLLMRSTMDSIFKVGFGVELNSLEGPEEGNTFMNAFDNCSEIIMQRYFNPLWKIMRFLNTGPEAKLKESIKLIDGFVYKLIHTKMEQNSKQDSDSMKKEDILSRFLVERERDPENMTDKYLRDIILNFLIAGKDTTAGTLSWFIYMLCKHPLVQEKVAEEVEEATKASENTKNINEFAKNLTDEALDRMHYLHAALSETLRLYPAVPLDSKVCFSDDTLPDGFTVKKGDIVFYQPYPMGRMKYLWGDDAEIFRPERWLDENGVFKPESPFKFIAFNAGPRICLGRDFAYRQMKIFAAVLVHFFGFKLSDKNKVVKYRTMITLHIDQGLHVNAFHRF